MVLRSRPVLRLGLGPGLAGVLLLSGCGGDEGEPAPAPLAFEDLVADHRADYDAAVEDCGSATVGVQQCNSALSAPEQCLWDAWVECSPAELELYVPIDDSASMRTHLFVRMGNYGCEIDLFRDHTSDPDKAEGEGDFTLETCAQLEGDYPDPLACDALTPLECEAAGDWSVE